MSESDLECCSDDEEAEADTGCVVVENDEDSGIVERLNDFDNSDALACGAAKGAFMIFEVFMIFDAALHARTCVGISRVIVALETSLRRLWVFGSSSSGSLSFFNLDFFDFFLEEVDVEDTDGPEDVRVI